MWVKFSLGVTLVKHDNTSFQGLQFSQLVVVLISCGADLTTGTSGERDVLYDLGTSRGHS